MKDMAFDYLMHELYGDNVFETQKALEKKGYHFEKYEKPYGYMHKKQFSQFGCTAYICVEQTGELGETMITNQTLQTEKFIYSQAELEWYSKALEKVNKEYEEVQNGLRKETN